MEISILLIEQNAELFLMILMGYIIVKTGLLKGEDSKVISKIVLYLVIPCVIINAFQVDYTSEKVKELCWYLQRRYYYRLYYWQQCGVSERY